MNEIRAYLYNQFPACYRLTSLSARETSNLESNKIVLPTSKLPGTLERMPCERWGLGRVALPYFFFLILFLILRTVSEYMTEYRFGISTELRFSDTMNVSLIVGIPCAIMHKYIGQR